MGLFLCAHSARLGPWALLPPTSALVPGGLCRARHASIREGLVGRWQAPGTPICVTWCPGGCTQRPRPGLVWVQDRVACPPAVQLCLWALSLVVCRSRPSSALQAGGQRGPSSRVQTSPTPQHRVQMAPGQKESFLVLGEI